MSGFSQPEVASESEKRAVFLDWHDHLSWTALMITGSPEGTNRAVVNASELAERANPIFQDWLVRWAREATARTAIDEVRDSLLAASAKYADIRCPHGKHDLLTLDQIDSLRKIPIEVVHEQLDLFACSVLVLRGVHQSSTASCARLLSVSRDRVCAAYCRAMQ